MENKYLDIAGNIHLSYFLKAADTLGIKYTMAIPSMSARFEINGKIFFINNTVTPLCPAPSAKLARSKYLTNKILSFVGLPVPIQQKIHSPIEAISFYGKYKDIVIKPVQNLGGKGITILPSSEETVIAAFEFATKNDKKGRVLAEEYIKGDNYRLLVLDDKVISTIRRTPAFVIGDGTNNIKALIQASNIKRREIGLLPIAVDLELEEKIKKQELSLESIPEKDKTIFLRSNANLTTGGTAEDITNSNIDPYYLDIAKKAVSELGMEYGGVDLITPDITKQVKCAINEVNYNPGVRLHYKAINGQQNDVALKVLEYIKNKYT